MAHKKNQNSDRKKILKGRRGGAVRFQAEEQEEADKNEFFLVDFQKKRVWELVENHLCEIEKLSNNPYANVHKTQIKKCEERVRHIGELCELLSNAQETFQDLLPLVSKDIMQEFLPLEYKRFFEVSKHWQYNFLKHFLSFCFFVFLFFSIFQNRNFQNVFFFVLKIQNCCLL